MADIQKDFEEWLDQDWPLWRQATDTGLIHKLRRTFEAAYVQGLHDENDRVLALLPGGQFCDPQTIADAIRRI